MTVEADGNGARLLFHVEDDGGIRSEAADSMGEALIASKFVNQLAPHGKTQIESLQSILRVAREAGVRISNMEEIRAALKRGWCAVLESALLPDPAHSYRERAGWFLTRHQVSIAISAIGKRLLTVGGPLHFAQFKLTEPSY